MLDIYYYIIYTTYKTIMSGSQIISRNNGKIFDELLPNPYPYPAFPSSLAQVLIAGDDAGNGNIENLLQLQATNIVQQAQIGGHLTIGGTPSNPGSGGDLRIQGATLKGSILAGDGTSTVGLPVGVDGLVLTTNSTTTTGLEWAVGGGGGGVASVSAGNNITVSGTVSNPIVAVASPLNATLDLGTQNTTGTTGALTYDDTVANSKGVLGAISLILSDSTFATGDQTQTNKSGYSALGSTDTTTHTKTGLSKTAGATDLTLSNSVASQNIALNTTSGIITTNCAIKPTAIRDSASSDGTSGQVLTAGTGGQLLWGANGVSSVSAGLNIGITGTSTAPIVGLLNPLTSGLGLGTQSVSGTSGSMTLVNAGSTTTIQAVSTRVADTTTVATNSLLSKTGLVVGTTGQTITYGSSNIVKTGTSLGISNTGSSINISAGIGIGLDSGSSVVQITQPALSQTKLKTSLTNHFYYPDAVITNQNSNAVIINVPEVPEGRLTCVNYGVIENNTWNPYGDTFDYGTGIRTFFRDSNSRIWTSTVGSNIIQIRDEVYTTPDIQNITLTGNSAEAYVFYEYNGFVFIGGSFTQIDANPQFQYNITRFQINAGFPYSFSPMFDSAGNVEGVNGSVYTIQSVGGIYNGDIVFGGNFTDTAPSLPLTPTAFICYITNSFNAPNTQNFFQFNGGTNNTVYTIHYGAGNYVWVGGDFTTVNSGLQNHNYCSAYDVSTGSGWNDVATNLLNSVVINIQPTAYGKVFLTGGFTALPGGQNYNTYIDVSVPATYDDTNLSGMSPFIERNCSFYNIPSGLNYVFNSGAGVFYNSAQTTWTTQGNPGTQGMTGDPAGINFWLGSLKVGTTSTSKLYTQITLTDSCNYQASGSPAIFKHLGVTYQVFTLGQQDIAQQFIAEPNCGFWVPIGGLVGTFS